MINRSPNLIQSQPPTIGLCPFKGELESRHALSLLEFGRCLLEGDRLLVRVTGDYFGCGGRRVISDNSGRQWIRIKWTPPRPRETCIVVGGL